MANAVLGDETIKKPINWETMPMAMAMASIGAKTIKKLITQEAMAILGAKTIKESISMIASD